MTPPVTVLVDRFPELSETFVTGQVRALAALGVPVRVEAGDHAERPDEAAARDVDVSFTSDDALAARLAALAWLVARHPLGCLRDLRSRRRWRREEGVRRLRTLAPAARRVRASGARHLHAEFAAGAALDAMRIAALLDLPYSVMTHGYDVFQLPRNLREKHARAAFAVTACDYSARWLRERFGVSAATLVVGVDPAVFRRRTPYPGGRTVVAVGRLVEKKGFAVLVEAARRVALDRVVIAGDGPQRSELVRRVDALGLDGVVTLAGEQTPAQVRGLLERADVLVAPSVVAADGDRDTMPVVVKEALAMEVPVVASDEVGLPEVVRPEWGRLVAPGDAVALAGALGELLALPAAERAAMGRAGRAWVESRFDARQGAQRLAQLIEAGAAR